MFIEITEIDGKKILINSDTIKKVYIDGKDRTVISLIGNSIYPIICKESYFSVKRMLEPVFVYYRKPGDL